MIVFLGIFWGWVAEQGVGVSKEKGGLPLPTAFFILIKKSFSFFFLPLCFLLVYFFSIPSPLISFPLQKKPNMRCSFDF